MSRQNDIDSKILEFLSKQDWPVTTEQISKAIGCTWHTTQIHLFQLVSKGRVKHKKVGRQNQFWLNKKYAEEF